MLLLDSSYSQVINQTFHELRMVIANPWCSQESHQHKVCSRLGIKVCWRSGGWKTVARVAQEGLSRASFWWKGGKQQNIREPVMETWAGQS